MKKGKKIVYSLFRLFVFLFKDFNPSHIFEVKAALVIRGGYVLEKSLEYQNRG